LRPGHTRGEASERAESSPRPVAKIGLLFATRDLALYGAIIATLGGAWSLYVGLVLDRARIVVSVSQALAVGFATSIPVVTLSVSNRGRRAVHISSIGCVADSRTGEAFLSMDFLKQLPIRLEEGEAHTFTHGVSGAHTPGSLPLTRWYVLDGAGRMHPLRERYRQRLERFVFWYSRRSH